MKQLSLPTPSSRRQRGFFRATAVFFSAALVGVGIMTIPQARARPASPKHHAHKPCLSAAVNNYERAVSLKAWQRLALGISDPAGAVRPGGTWQSDFGIVDTHGIYTAPRFTPPEGMDRLHYLDPNNDDVWINVRILPNPSIPGSAKTPFVTFDYLRGNSTCHGGQAAQMPSAVPKAPFAPTRLTVVELPGQTPAPPLKIAASASLKARTVNGKRVLILPAVRGGGDATSAVYTCPLSAAPQQVVLTPDVSLPVGPSTAGEVSVYGPYTVISAPEKGTINLIDGTVGVEVISGANTVLMTREVGDFHVQGQSYDWKRTRTRYIYIRSHKKWVLESVLHRDSWTISWITNPPGAVLAEGYPQNNQPLLPFGAEDCHF